MDMKLEVVVLPVSDIDRAKAFYEQLGWRVDADVAGDNGFRLVQINPSGSLCSIQFGSGLTNAEPGSARALHLAVTDIEGARDEIAGRGIAVSEVYHCDAGFGCRYGEPGEHGKRVSGPEPEHRTYSSFASFRDPDGNGWVLQEITSRLPGR